MKERQSLVIARRHNKDRKKKEMKEQQSLIIARRPNKNINKIESRKEGRNYKALYHICSIKYKNMRHKPKSGGIKNFMQSPMQFGHFWL